jgi:hypothetical protein
VADGQLVDWWRAGDAIMPVMLAVAGVLYLRIGERAWALWSTGGRARADAILAGLDAPTHPERAAWAAHYAGIAAEAELTRGLGLFLTERQDTTARGINPTPVKRGTKRA